MWCCVCGALFYYKMLQKYQRGYRKSFPWQMNHGCWLSDGVVEVDVLFNGDFIIRLLMAWLCLYYPSEKGRRISELTSIVQKRFNFQDRKSTIGVSVLLGGLAVRRSVAWLHLFPALMFLCSLTWKSSLQRVGIC